MPSSLFIKQQEYDCDYSFFYLKNTNIYKIGVSDSCDFGIEMRPKTNSVILSNILS